MRKVFLFAFALVACLSFKAQDGLLYRVYGEGITDTSYVYGTYHTKDSRAFFMKDEIKALILKCDVVAGEVDMEEAKENAGAMAPLMILPGEKTLADLYSEEDYQKVSAFLKDQLGLQSMLCNRLKPFFVMAMLTEKMIEGDEKMVLDEWIQKQAHKSKREVIGLETMEEALAGVSSMTIKEQADWLMELVVDFDSQSAMIEDMNRWYLNQEVDSMYQFYMEEDIPGEFDSEFIIRRNIYFVDRTFEQMKEHRVFCAVGALHLPGDTGMVEGLRAKGVTVEVVE